MSKATSIPFHKAAIGEDEINEVVDTLKSGWLTMGPKTIAFEKAFAQVVGSTHAVAMNSATACLHLALKAIGLQAGDEVIIPAPHFISTAEVVTYFNATPVLCDIRATDHNMDPTKVEAHITSKTKAIIPVHFSGIPCDMPAIQAIATKHNLKVIEDAAHALPSTLNGQMIGSFSDVTCFSFYATKTLATGEGGMATTNNEAYAKSMRQNRLHGISKDAWNRYSDKGHWYYEAVDNGYKYNMTDVAASLGLVQLKRLHELHKKRCTIAEAYDQAFKSHPAINVLNPPIIPKGAWHLYVIKVDQRDQLMATLKAAGIGTSFILFPFTITRFINPHISTIVMITRSPMMCMIGHYPCSIFPDMSMDDVSTIVDTVLANV